VPEYIRPLFCEGKGPFRWRRFQEKLRTLRDGSVGAGNVSRDEHLHRWIKLAQKRVKFQGLPSRICWLDTASETIWIGVERT